MRTPQEIPNFRDAANTIWWRTRGDTARFVLANNVSITNDVIDRLPSPSTVLITRGRAGDLLPALLNVMIPPRTGSSSDAVQGVSAPRPRWNGWNSNLRSNLLGHVRMLLQRNTSSAYRSSPLAQALLAVESELASIPDPLPSSPALPVSPRIVQFALSILMLGMNPTIPVNLDEIQLPASTVYPQWGVDIIPDNWVAQPFRSGFEESVDSPADRIPAPPAPPTVTQTQVQAMSHPIDGATFLKGVGVITGALVIAYAVVKVSDAFAGRASGASAAGRAPSARTGTRRSR